MDYRKQRMTGLGRWAVERRAAQTLKWCQCPPHGMIMELGVGRGVLARLALARGLRYFAVDSDREVLRNLPIQAIKLHRHLPIRHTFCSEGKFDSIVCEAMIEHVPGCAEAVEMLVWCRKLLRPGGRLVLRFPDVCYHRWQFWAYTPDHQWVTSLWRVCEAIQWAEGFRIMRAGHSIDQFTGWRMWLIAAVVQMVPTMTLHRLAHKGPNEWSMWLKLRQKRPQGYVVAEKQ